MAKDKAAGKGGTQAADRPKTKCPISLETFKKKATPIEISIGGQTRTANPQAFKTGSFGWYLGEKIEVEIDGKKCKVQVGMNLTVVGSKEAPTEDDDEA